MTDVVDFDPPDYGLRMTARRLAGVWREQWRLTAIALLYALAYSGLSLAIPLLVARAIDGSIVGDDRPLWPLLVAIVVLAALRSGVNFLRRYATARVGVGVEARMRELLYAVVPALPARVLRRASDRAGRLARDERPLPDPLLHRLGHGGGRPGRDDGVGAGVVLVLTNPTLALWSALPLPLIALVAWRFAHRVTPISRAVQRRKGDVTESADEAVVGIEMVQAFGREGDVQERFADRARGLRDEILRQARVESHHLPSLFYLPSVSVAIVLFFGGRAVIDGTLTYGEFALFIQLLLQLVWPLESMGWIINLGPARAGLGRALVRVARSGADAARAGSQRSRCRPGGRASRCAASASPTRAASPCCAASISRWCPARCSPSAADRRGQVDAARARPALLRPRRTAASRSRGRDLRSLAHRRRARRHRAGHAAARSCSPTRCARTCSPVARMRRGPTSSARARSRA